MATHFIEAESFETLGGWVIDSQSVLQMGSAYIMAHGLGKKVADAETNVGIEKDGEYSFWVRTRNWTAPWSEKAAGKFQLAIDGATFETELGTNGKEWAWQFVGKRKLEKGEHTLSLQDSTGFNGRCDAVYFTDGADTPPDSGEAMETLRKQYYPTTEDAEEYDLIVVGGGIAGVCLAISAQRYGCKVVLLQDRGVLGGCNSSEIRVCLGGGVHVPPYANIGNVLEEISPLMGSPALYESKYYEDDRKEIAFMRNRGYKPFPGQNAVRFHNYVFAADCQGGVVKSVLALNTRTGERVRYKAKLFADCSGDAVLARLCGAETMYGAEARTEFSESLGRETHENLVMGQSVRWYSKNAGKASPFPEFDFGLTFNEATCLHVISGDWEQESGFRRDMANETEYIRDYNLLAIFSNWSYQKNRSIRKSEYENLELVWASPIGGKRESFRVKGDLILTQNDIENKSVYDDQTACLTWNIDIHYPEYDNERQCGEAFRSIAYHRGIEGPYGVPYRCLYSKDISNLFLGGRTVSCSHVAFSSVRVMRTLGMLGEVAGMAAAICKEYDCYPREVYTQYLEELKRRMREGVPTPLPFECPSRGRTEYYHFKDAGRIRCGNESEYQSNPYYEKVKRNIENLGIAHNTHDTDLFRK